MSTLPPVGYICINKYKFHYIPFLCPLRDLCRGNIDMIAIDCNRGI